MKKDRTSAEQREDLAGWTAGIDVGDRYSRICILDAGGAVIEESRVRTTPAGFERYFEGRPAMRVALEVGTHSPWLSELLACEHEVFVANPRKLRLIYENEEKADEVDAEMLARVARMDPKLLKPVQHRDRSSQAAQTLLRSRDALVRARTKLVNHVRGSVKPLGARMPGGSAASFHKKVDSLPAELSECLTPVMKALEALEQQIMELDRQIEQACREDFTETEVLLAVHGVGHITALAFVLTFGDVSRFERVRSAGPYLGLKPRRNQTGGSDPELRITKAGNSYLRRLLVGSAHRIIGPFGADSDLRRWGLALAARGRKNAKKRAAVAVARKLAVLLLSLLKSGEPYDPLRNAKRLEMAAGAAPATT